MPQKASQAELFLGEAYQNWIDIGRSAEESLQMAIRTDNPAVTKGGAKLYAFAGGNQFASIHVENGPTYTCQVQADDCNKGWLSRVANPLRALRELATKMGLAPRKGDCDIYTFADGSSIGWLRAGGEYMRVIYAC